MKIIKVSDEWHEPTFKNVKVKCSGCDSELEIESEDVMESIGVLFFECPVCFKRNILKSDVKERYLNWIEYKNKKNRTREDIERDTEREKFLKRAVLKELGEIAKECE